MSGNIFSFENDQALAQVAQGVVGSPFSEVFQSCLDTELGNWLWVVLLK